MTNDVVSTQKVLGPEFNITEPFNMETVVFLWEQMSQEVIDSRIKQLEASIVQIDAALDKIVANGAKGGADWVQLEAKKVEADRQLVHTKTVLVPGELVFKAKTKGLVEVRVGQEWNKGLERHVVVSGGIITRVLPQSPV